MNPKLRKKLILVVALAIIYLIFIMNIHKIKFAVGMLSIYNQEKNTQTVIEGENHNDPVIVDKPIIVDSPLQTIIDNKESVDKTEEPIYPQKPIATPTKSYIKIVEEYNDVLEKLRVKFEGNLDELIQQGIKEYKGGETSSGNLFVKYMTEGSKLEKVSDEQFDTIIKDMKKELETNGHDSSIIKELKNYYEEFKTLKKENIISKGMKYIE